MLHAEEIYDNSKSNCLAQNENQTKEEKSDKLSASVTEKTIPPPPYTLTSPCLPPININPPSWLPEPLPPFIGHPPYPAGPPLLGKEYPKILPGPTFACPRCSGQFLIRNRANMFFKLGLYCIFFALIYEILELIFDSPNFSFFIASSTLIVGFSLVLKGFLLKTGYPEAKRIEFC
ncbi:unnamed protein product [Dracunculus medinensis]|uniref:LITAF domain-containing protein n=1 Tax=Dracunculus medinensis TaxID=318479 RepID=A0A158Q2H4_DRAME|nr:unnamed protein product [Dracunculus medinensis]